MKNKPSLLGVGTDAKTVKGEAIGVLTGILYLAPSNQSGVMNTCQFASAGCRASCLYSAGRGSFPNVKRGRIAKTIRFFENQEQFMRDLVFDIAKLVRKAAKNNLVPAVRLNGTSDVAWETVLFDGKNIMAHFPDIQFYDYCKSIARARLFGNGGMPVNYHLTFSKSENNDDQVMEAIKLGVNVAVVFAGKTLPATYLGRPVVDGDLSDVRFADGTGVIVGLKAKGKARKDKSGFVVSVA